jgi:hypothetical protein
MTWDTQHNLNATKLHSHWLNRCPWCQIGKQDSFHNKRSPVSKYNGLQMRQALAPRQFHKTDTLRISTMWFWACHPVCNKRMWQKEMHRQKLSVFALKRRPHWNSARFFNWMSVCQCLSSCKTEMLNQKTTKVYWDAWHEGQCTWQFSYISQLISNIKQEHTLSCTIFQFC